jgi:hypothetical protein
MWWLNPTGGHFGDLFRRSDRPADQADNLIPHRQPRLRLAADVDFVSSMAYGGSSPRGTSNRTTFLPWVSWTSAVISSGGVMRRATSAWMASMAWRGLPTPAGGCFGSALTPM